MTAAPSQSNFNCDLRVAISPRLAWTYFSTLSIWTGNSIFLLVPEWTWDSKTHSAVSHTYKWISLW